MEVDTGAVRGQDAWAGFNVLNKHIFPHIKRCRATDDGLVTTQCAVANGEEGAHGRLEASKEHELTWTLRKSTV